MFTVPSFRSERGTPVRWINRLGQLARLYVVGSIPITRSSTWPVLVTDPGKAGLAVRAECLLATGSGMTWPPIIGDAVS